MVTEADWTSWTDVSLKRYFEFALEAFEPSRLMFGSDWPVVSLACSYERWMQAGAVAALTPGERRQVFHDSAVAAYGLLTIED
jgi:L-fuconolactonase